MSVCKRSMGIFAASFWTDVAVPAVGPNDSLLIQLERTRLVVTIDELRNSDGPDELIELT